VIRLTLAALAVCLTGCASMDLAPTSVAVPTAMPTASATGAPAGPELVAGAPAADGRPSQPSMAARFAVALVDDHCADRDLAAPPASDPILTILDRTYALASDYEPTDLVPASSAGLTGVSGTKLVRSVVVDDLRSMREAWEAAGLEVLVDSAYRSYASQAATFEDWAARLGPAAALLRTARPGHSEHQLGTALDLSSPGWSGRFGDWAVESPEGAWMAEHGWEHGFVMSYPAGAGDETCFGYEPWHYRWIGRDAAAEHRTSGLSLRTYLERHAGG
jgi:zinc D-Ala-D-Ala carboxypeptidase